MLSAARESMAISSGSDSTNADTPEGGNAVESSFPEKSSPPCDAVSDMTPPAGAPNENTGSLRRTRYKQTIPKLDPPPQPLNRKRSNRTLSPGVEAESRSSAVATPVNGNAFTNVSGSSSFPDITLCSVSPGDFYSHTNGNSVSCSASEDSGVRSNDKSLVSPQSRDDPSDDQSSAFISTSSTCSSLPEDHPAVNGGTTPLGYEQTIPFSSPMNDTCLHISLSEDEFLEDGTYNVTTPCRS
ncbi:hypothetical protein PO909_025941 [Leuciscus waleckii]